MSKRKSQIDVAIDKVSGEIAELQRLRDLLLSVRDAAPKRKPKKTAAKYPDEVTK